MAQGRTTWPWGALRQRDDTLVIAVHEPVADEQRSALDAPTPATHCEQSVLPR
ncbi:hypothetical protein ACFQ7O_24645 [Streptomyces sp. NPDC056485]|uniref:hypothetical protein n=1 Tax=unclassified Streptomyces TaxID=2593676 RepID=UPI0036AB934F